MRNYNLPDGNKIELDDRYGFTIVLSNDAGEVKIHPRRANDRAEAEKIVRWTPKPDERWYLVVQATGGIIDLH